MGVGGVWSGWGLGRLSGGVGGGWDRKSSRRGVMNDVVNGI